jgi:hypothetical protein
MKQSYQKIGGLGILLAVLAGCGSATPPQQEGAATVNPHALAGYPPLPAQGEPAPLTSTPFGLFSTPPSPATIAALSTGVTSPDGRFRAALTDQGAWIVRIDGAWYWQVELTTVAPPPAQAGQRPPANGQSAPTTGQSAPTTGQQAATGQQPPAGQAGLAPATATQTAVAVGGWTPASQLLVQAHTGAWYEADPLTATVTPLAPFWQGRSNLLLSPDGKQILYSQPGPKGPQVWVANKDGSRPTLVADNATAVWGADNKPVVTKLPEPVAPTAPRQSGTTPPKPPANTTPPATTPPAPPSTPAKPGT